MKKPIVYVTKFHEGSKQLFFVLKLYDECSINLQITSLVHLVGLLEQHTCLS